jgi:hypothetical protein
MRSLAIPTMPPWAEKLVVMGMKKYFPPEVVKEAMAGYLASLLDWAKAMTAKTETKIDDRIVAMVADLVTQCPPEAAFLCELMEQGETVLLMWLRAGAANTETEIDDAAVDILEAALKLEAA